MDGTVSLWRNQAGKQAPDVIKVHFSPVRACDISQDERLLVSGSDDKLVKLSSLKDCRGIASFVGHSNWVRSTAFSPNAHLVASGGDDKTVRLWSTERKEVLRVWYDVKDSVSSVCFDSAGASVAACAADSTIDIWDCRTQELRQHYGCAHGNSPITQVAFHPAQDILLSCSVDNTLRLWDLRAGRLRSTIAGQEKPIKSCCWDDDGTRFISCDSRLISIWAFRGTKRESLDPEVRATAWKAFHPPAPPLAASPQKLATTSADSTNSQAELSTRGASMPRKELTSTLASHATTRPSQAEGRTPYLKLQSSTDDTAKPLTLSGLGRGGEDTGELGIRDDFVPAQKPDVLEAVGKTCEHLITEMDILTASLQAFESRLISVESATAEVTRMMQAQRGVEIVCSSMTTVCTASDGTVQSEI
jgi:WD40 repeat protein